MNTFTGITCAKTAYINQEDANLAASRMQEFIVLNIEAYFCAMCKGWHIGLVKK